MSRILKKLFKTSVGAGFGCSAIYVADLAINDDLDDLNTLPKRLWYYTFPPSMEDLEAIQAGKKKIVILGTGWGCQSFLKKVDPTQFNVTIVSPRNHFFYTPMLTGVATGTVKASSIMEGIRTSWPMPSMATFYRAEATELDVTNKQITVVDSMGKTKLDYDHLIIGVGAEPNTFGIKGVAENAFFMKELNDGMKLRKHILDTLENANAAYLAHRSANAAHNTQLKKAQAKKLEELLTFVIVGGGPTGVEFAAEFSDYVNRDIKRLYPKLDQKIAIHLIEAFPNILNVFPKHVSAQVQEHLGEAGVNVIVNAAVTGATNNSVSFQHKEDKKTTVIDTNTLVWTGGIRARPITAKLGQAINKGVQTDRRGLLVDDRLRVKGLPEGHENDIFALGDCAFSGLPPTAQVASQQGTYLGRLFRDYDADAQRAEPFQYRHHGIMTYIGDGEAAVSLPQPKFGGNFFASLYEEAASRETREKQSQNDGHIDLVGGAGFAVWRSVYFSKVVSWNNRYNIATDWLRAIAFGRNASSALQQSFTAVEK